MSLRTPEQRFWPMAVASESGSLGTTPREMSLRTPEQRFWPMAVASESGSLGTTT
jgi:hypothetical protein